MYSVLKALYRGKFQYFRPFSLIPDETYTIELHQSWPSLTSEIDVNPTVTVVIYPPHFAVDKNGKMFKKYINMEDLLMDWWVLNKPGDPYVGKELS